MRFGSCEKPLGNVRSDLGMEFYQFENHPKVIVRMDGRFLLVDVGVEGLEALRLPGLYDLAEPLEVGEHSAFRGRGCRQRLSNSASMRRL